jgi:hypothetical protein
LKWRLRCPWLTWRIKPLTENQALTRYFAPDRFEEPATNNILTMLKKDFPAILAEMQEQQIRALALICPDLERKMSMLLMADMIEQSIREFDKTV